MTQLKTLLGGIAVAALSLSIVAKTVRADEDKLMGARLPVQSICQGQEPIAMLIRTVEQNKGSFAEANVLFERYVAEGKCAKLPVPTMGLIQETGYASKVFTAPNGKLVKMTAARVGADIWIAAVEEIDGGNS